MLVPAEFVINLDLTRIRPCKVSARDKSALSLSQNSVFTITEHQNTMVLYCIGIQYDICIENVS